jgi:transcription elongation factor Elf1
MHRYLTEHDVTCPFCGETITLLVDASAGTQEYIEDCQVCCRPMQVSIAADDGEVDELRVDCAS